MKTNLTKISDLTAKDIEKIIKQAFAIKGKFKQKLKGKVIAMIFEKPSLRTKIAFEAAAYHLGAFPVFLSSGQILASGNNEKGRESIPDIAKNLERFADLIVARVYEHKTIQTIAANISKPVINALCNKHHPTQALADLMAIKIHKKNKPIKVCFIGDGNNVATSLMQICATMGITFSMASPKGYKIPDSMIQNTPNKYLISQHLNPEQAIKESDVVYTDTFISMGEEHLKEEKLKDFKNYQVNMALLKKAKQDAIFMHCLPAHRGEEVSDGVMDCSQSIVFDQAECRLHIAKSLLLNYLS